MKVRTRSVWLPAVTLVATSCITGAVLSLNDSARAVIKTARPGAWMASSSAGSVSHVGPDGVDATVALQRTTGDLKVVQIDGVAYVTDADGRLSRIDPAQLEVTQEAMLPSSTARLVAGGGRLYAVDPAAGTVRELDPVQLTSIGEAVHVGTKLGSAVVDANGVLWVTDLATGTVIRFDGRTPEPGRKVSEPGVDVHLSVVGSDIVAVNPATSTATVVSGATTSAPHPVPSDSGSTLDVPDVVDEGSVLPIVSGDHTLSLLQVRTGQVRTVDLGVSGHKLGAPKVSGGKVYLADFTNGSVLVVDIAAARLAATITVTGHAGEFEVLVDGATVYVNDPHSEHAWTITPSGDLVPADKYDPNSPRGGGTVQAVVPPAPALPPTPADGNQGKGKTPPPPSNAVPTTSTTVEPDKGDGNGEEPTTTTTPAKQPHLGGPDRSTTTSTAPASGAGNPADPTTTTTDNRGGGRGRSTTTTTTSSATTNDARPGDDGTTPGNSPGHSPGDGGTTTTAQAGSTPPVDTGDGAVSSVVAVSGDASATVTWAPPAGWRSVSGFTVVVRSAAGDAPAVKVKGDVTTYTATSLQNGRQYTFDVTATGKSGTGRTVSSNPVVPARDQPPAAKIVSVTPGDGQVDVVWSWPSGVVIDSYLLEIVDASGATVASRTLPASTTSATVTGFANGAQLRAVIYAQVNDGSGPVIGRPATSSTFVTRGRPLAPGSVIAAVTGAGRARVTWQPAGNNGSPITGYSIVATETAGGGAPMAGPGIAGDATQAEITGLKVGISYAFTVSATNAYGTASATSSPLVIDFTDPPGAPGAVTAVAGYHAVAVSWTPANGNGTTVASYIVRNLADGTTRTAPAAATSLTFDGLTPGTSPAFDVRAIGANGKEGLSAATAAVAVIGTPAPAGLIASATSTTAVALTFDQPAPTGPAIVSWKVTTTPDTGVHTLPYQPAVSFPITGLAPATVYTFTIVAVDSAGGESPPVAASGATATPTGPAAVAGLQATTRIANTRTGTTRVSFTWLASPGATSYRFDRGNGAAPVTVTATTYAFTGIGDDLDYTASVVAIGTDGESSPATIAYNFVYYDPIDPGCIPKPGGCIPP